MIERHRSLAGVSLALGAAGGALYLVDQFRTVKVSAREEMTWECTSHSALHPGPIVLLRFLRAPEYFSFREDPTGSFCRFVSQTPLPTVWVVSELHGNKRDGFESWTDETLDDRPIPLGFNGADGTYGQPTHIFPYQQDFDVARHRSFKLLQ